MCEYQTLIEGDTTLCRLRWKYLHCYYNENNDGCEQNNENNNEGGQTFVRLHRF